MSSSRPTPVPVGIKAVIWSLAIGVAVIGVTAAITSGSWWPLVALAGLFLPMMPVGKPRRASSESRSART